MAKVPNNAYRLPSFGTQHRRPDRDRVNTLFALGCAGPSLEFLEPVQGDYRSRAEVTVTECV